jgi:hypothetical protein
MQSFSKLSAFLVAAALASACGVDHSRNVLVPSDVPSATTSAPQPGANATPSLIGMWVAATTTTESTVGARAITTPTSCPTFTFTISSQTATEASGTYAAHCAGSVDLAGTISGRLGDPIALVATGTATAPGVPACTFTLNGAGILASSTELHIDYTGTTCFGPVSGSTTLRKATPAAPPAPPPPPPPPADPPPPPPVVAPDPLLGCGDLVAGGDPYRVIACIHDRLNPPHTTEGAFEVTKRVAWAYRNQGWGLLIKNGGENIVSWQGRSFSASRVCLPDGHIYKVLSDVPTTNGPSFQDNGFVDPGLYVPAIDPNS